jgi:hypothetical protein
MTDDLRTISIILCSPLGLPPEEQRTVPLLTDEFNFVGTCLWSRLHLKPTAFLDTDPKSLCYQLELDDLLSARIVRLLARAGNLAFDQSSVAATGISIVSRKQNEYPAALKTNLGKLCPPVLFMAGSADEFPSNIIAIAPFAQQQNALPFAEALIAQHHHSPVAYAVDLDHAVTEILMAHQNMRNMRLYVTTQKPLQGLIRQKTYRTAIQNGTLVLISLTHPLSNNTQSTHKNLWIGFSAHIIHALDDQTYALQSLTPEQIQRLYTESTHVDHVPFDLTAVKPKLLDDLRLHSFDTLILRTHAEQTQNGIDRVSVAEETVLFDSTAGKPILLDDLRLHSFDTLILGTHTEQTKNGTDSINVAEETDLLSIQYVEESTQKKPTPQKPESGIKRTRKKKPDNSQQESNSQQEKF